MQPIDYAAPSKFYTFPPVTPETSGNVRGNLPIDLPLSEAVRRFIALPEDQRAMALIVGPSGWLRPSDIEQIYARGDFPKVE